MASSIIVTINGAMINSTCIFYQASQLYKNGNYYEASFSKTDAGGGTVKGYIKIELGANSITVVDGQYGIAERTGSWVIIKWTNETLPFAYNS